jgi:prepilin-type N-terminal cleavage/methylation domain-containing protein
MRYPHKAFTLVELLVAVAVIAVGMVYVLSALGRCVMTLAIARQMVTASFLLDGRLWELDELYREEQGAEEGTDQGTFSEPYERFAWTRTTTGVSAQIGDEFNQTGTLRDAFLEETVRVFWQQGKATRDIGTTRYVVRRQLLE